MRIFFTTAVMLCATSAAPSVFADEFQADNYQMETEDSGNELEAIGWNRWRCVAREQGVWWGRSYVGFSHYFEQGSGEGVQGQNIARLMAQRECEFNQAQRSWGRQGNCQVFNCDVQRY